MNKRERLEAAIAGQGVDRAPVALWRHFPGDDQDPVSLAAATIAFQQRWNFDKVGLRVQSEPASEVAAQNFRQGKGAEWST